jgi:hypothetical protein
MSIEKLICVSIFVVAASADVRTPFPPDPGAPLYTYLQRTADGSAFFANDGEWAAIWFFRDPGCIPADFNLLNTVDLTPAFPGGPPRPFLCPLTVSGFDIWKNGPFPIDSVPLQESDSGSAVPVWFVKAVEFRAAAADDVVTIGEIQAMPSLRKGIARTFETVDHFGAYRPQGEGKGSIETTANGTLQDGAAFQVEFREMGVKNGDGVSFVRHIRIDFR